jgi:hypothetical protein
MLQSLFICLLVFVLGVDAQGNATSTSDLLTNTGAIVGFVFLGIVVVAIAVVALAYCIAGVSTDRPRAPREFNDGI